jgi:hypothetical protein
VLRIDTRPRHRNAPRPAWKVATAYLQWLRGRPCAFEQTLGGCWGKIEAMHTPDPQSKAMGSKAADHNAIPGCQGHHKAQTDKGWSAVGLDRERAQALAAAYWRAWKGDKGELANG